MAAKSRVVDPETGKSFCIGGCLISDKPSDLPKFGASNFLSDKDLPPSVDLRLFMTDIEEQGQCYACVGNAIAGAYEFLIKKRCKEAIDVSRLFIYYNSRLKDGLGEYNMEDRGTFIRSAIEASKEFGCCTEESYQYDLTRINRKPPSHCYSEAMSYRITEAKSLRANLTEMKACLAQGYPFAFGLHIYDSFMKAGRSGKGGRIPMPKPKYESQAVEHGWHAMLAVGYSDENRCFFVRNSFGPDWGDKGYCYIPYDYMCDSQECVDLHSIKLIADGIRRRPKEEDHRKIQNPDNNRVAPIPEDILNDEVDYKDFWNFNDTFDYIDKIWKKRRAEHFIWKKTPELHHISSYHVKKVFRNNQYPMRDILWIDRESDGTNQMVQQLKSDKSLQIDFYETLSEAEKHLSTHMNHIKSTSTFQIICRGYYIHENKNPLNLLQFLNRHGLEHVPILVFTQDKSGVQHHLQQQAPSMGINDWKQRLIITESADELVRKCKENMNK